MRRPPRSIATRAATLALRRTTWTSVVREKRYGRADLMSSTGAGRVSVGAAGFVLTVASVLWANRGPGPAQRALQRAQPARAGRRLRLRGAGAGGPVPALRRRGGGAGGRPPAPRPGAGAGPPP